MLPGAAGRGHVNRVVSRIFYILTQRETDIYISSVTCLSWFCNKIATHYNNSYMAHLARMEYKGHIDGGGADNPCNL